MNKQKNMVSACLDDELHARLLKSAKNHQRTLSGMVRIMVIKYLANEDSGVNDQHNPLMSLDNTQEISRI
jgi:predicted DNA-binding ribbon-helix-helix protein